MLEKVTVELDLAHLDEDFEDIEDFKKRCKEVEIVYRRDWTDTVAFTVKE
jgi:hypothetical protein